MPQNQTLQNNSEASQFDAHFADMVGDAQTQEAIDFGEQFSDGKEPAPQEPDSSLVGQIDNSLGSSMKDANGTPLKRAGIGVARDISLGVLQSPRHVLRGAAQGVNSMLDFINAVSDFTPTITPLDEQGKIRLLPSLVSGAEAGRRLNTARQQAGKEPIDTGLHVPVPDPARIDTLTGDAIEAVSQFAVGLKGTNMLAGAAAAGKAGSIVQKAGQFIGGNGFTASVAKGAIADVLAFDQHQERLSNVIEKIPALKNPVTDFLQAKPDDGFAEGKLKQAIEGIGLGAAGEALFRGVSLLKKGKAAKADMDAAGGTIDDLFDIPVEEKAGIGVDAKDFTFIGDPADDALWRKKSKIALAEQEVQGAFGKTKQIPETPSPTIDDYEINFSRIEGPDDIKRLMDDMVNKPELKQSIEAERRGTQSTNQSLAAAQDIDGFDSLLSRRTGDAFNAEQIVAGRKVYYDTTTKLMDAAKRAAGPNATDVDQFNFRKMVAVHHAVQKEFMGIRAEAGRALQAWRIPLGGTGAENMRAMEDVLNSFGGPAASKQLAQRLAEIGNGISTTQVNAITQKSALARTGDAINEAWTLGLLTNPQTHIVNLSSNIMTSLTLGMERFAMAGMKDSPVTIREGAAFFGALLDSQKLAIKNMAQAFRTGESGFGLGKIDIPRTRASARDILDPEGKAGILSKALDGYGAILDKYAGRALLAGDEYSKTVLYQAQSRALATRQAIAEGLEGKPLADRVADILSNPSSQLKADAATFASYGTFTKQLGQGGQAVQKLIATWPAMRYIVPFVRTPANIFKFTFERTPLAVLSRKVRDDMAAGGLRRATALSKIGMGTSIMAIGSDMALNGKISGSGPSDPEIRSAMRRTGWQPYSIKIGDTWYSYARFEPVATLLGLAADTSEILSNYEVYDIQAQDQADEFITAAVIAASNQVIGKTFLRGFADTVEMLSDPGRYGEAYLQRFASSFIPAGVAAVERAVDPAMEQVFTLRDAVRSRIPGLSAAVPPRRNIWGEEIKYFYPNDNDIASSTAERISSLFNPVYSSKEKDDAVVDQWMLKNGFDIGMPDKVQRFDGARVDLRDHPTIYDRMTVLRGNELKLQKYGNQGMHDFFRNLVSEQDPYGRHLGFFMSLGNNYDDQQNFISGVVRDYQDAAKKQLIDEFPELSDAIAQQQSETMKANAVRPSMLVKEGVK